MAIGGFVPIKYINIGRCRCGQIGYINISYFIYGTAGIVTGLLFSYPLHRLMLVSHTQPEATHLGKSRIAHFGKAILSWRAILVLATITSVYIVGNIITYRNTRSPTFGAHQNLHCAVILGDMKKARRLIEDGVNINSRIPKNYSHHTMWFRTPLHSATRNGQNEIARYLIKNGADVKDDYPGMAPIHYAAKYCSKKTVLLLVEKGADIHRISYDGYSTLHFASSGGNIENLELLLNKGVPIDVLTPSRRTPLHWAVLGNSPEVVHFLIMKGADINAVDFQEKTALDMAKKHKKSEMIELLISLGAKSKSGLGAKEMNCGKQQ
ncbi:MAG: ankyrin repeat domain-containing protein [Planctomycetota bacterium]